MNNNTPKSRKFLLHCGISSLAAMVAITGISNAEEDSETPQFEEIVVTSRKKQELIVEVPMNITAVGQNEILHRNLVNKEDLFRTAAGVSMAFREVIIRGLSSGNTAVPGTSSTFTDGIPFDFSDLYDVERVEILRGPQGTLWGSNAIGGTVQVVTNKPNLNELEAFGSTQLSAEKNVNGLDVKAYAGVNVPIIEDKLALRIVGSGSYTPGKILNTFTGNKGYRSDYWLRAQLLWQLNDDMRINFGYVHDQYYREGDTSVDVAIAPHYYTMNLTPNDGSPYGWDVSHQRIDCPANVTRVGCRQNADLRNGINEKYAIWELLDQWDEEKVDMATFEFTHDNIGDFMSLTWNGSYRDRRQASLDNWSRLDANDLFRTWIVNHDSLIDSGERITSEIRFQNIDSESPFDWTVGGFYDKFDGGNVPDLQYQYHQGDDNGQTFAKALYWWGVDAAATGQDLYGDPNKNYNINQVENWTKEIALFGEASYTVDMGNGGQLELTAGLRYFELSAKSHIVESGIWVGDEALITNNDGKETGTRKKFSINYMFDQDLAIYALYSEGYRPGGNNFPSLPQSCVDDSNAQFFVPRYNSDSIKNYEMGIKGFAADRRVQFSAAVYRIDWSDVHTSIYMADCGFSYTVNADFGGTVVRAEGVEFEAKTLLTEGLTLTTNGSYTKSRFLVDVDNVGALAGDDVTMVPKYNYYVALDQNMDFWGKPGFVRASLSGYGEHKSNHQTIDKDKSPAYAIVDMAASFEANDNVSVSLHVDNLLNTEIIHFRSNRSRNPNSSAKQSVYYGNERTITVRADFKF